MSHQHKISYIVAIIHSIKVQNMLYYCENQGTKLRWPIPAKKKINSKIKLKYLVITG